MPKSGHRHLLIIYQHMLDRWWRATLAIGIFLLILAAGLGGMPLLLPQYNFLWVEDWRLWAVGGSGGFALLFTFFLIGIRKKAYVQPFLSHLRLITPFLRLNISYQRLQRAYATQIQQLFPPKKISSWRREILRPLATRTAVILELNTLPLSRAALRLFLSPFFFPDKTPRLAILVPDWIAFSTELESLRGVWLDSQNKPGAPPQTDTAFGVSRKNK